MDFLSDNLMRCVPTCPTWHRYFSSFLSWLNLTPAEHADWIKLPRQTVSPPTTNLRLNLLSFPLIFQRDQWCKTSICGHLRTTEKTAQQQQQQRHSHWIIHHSQKRFFLTVQKKKKKEKTNKPESCLKPGRRIILCICDCSFLGCFDNRVRKIILVMKWWPSQRT